MTIAPRTLTTAGRALTGLVLTFFVAVFLPPTLFWPLLGAAWGACVLAAAWLWRADRAGALGFAGAAVLGPLLLAAYWFALRLLASI